MRILVRSFQKHSFNKLLLFQIFIKSNFSGILKKSIIHCSSIIFFLYNKRKNSPFLENISSCRLNCNFKMNFRKSLRSLHCNQQSHQSLKKIQLKEQDLQCSQYKQAAQSTKQSQNAILNKLLLQPPSMKNNSQKKLSVHTQGRKYEQKFQKPDVQNLIQQNINLKNLIQSNNHTISSLKIKNIELDKKIKLLEKGLQKFEKNILQSKQNKQINSDQIKRKYSNNQNNADEKQNKDKKQRKESNEAISNFSKTGMVHTEILKKKIADLASMYKQTQNELNFIKKLPTATIYQENDIEKEHLIAQVVRLKAIITSLSQELHHSNSEGQTNQKFQNQFMRLMKEQNQKLKATIRLLQNDKVLLKSRQTIQNKLNSNLKQEIEHLKQKLLYKESQLQKLNNENKNLLFKKTTQFRQEQQKKENQIIQELRGNLNDLQKQKQKIEEIVEACFEQNVTLKQKQKLRLQQISDLEVMKQKEAKMLRDKIEDLKSQLSNANYLNEINAENLKKKKSAGLGFNKQNIDAKDRALIRRESGFADLAYENSSSMSQKFSLKKQKSLLSKQVYVRPIKWEQISLPMINVYTTLKQNSFITIDNIIRDIQEQNQIKCIDLINVFSDQPFHMNRKEATKLSRYIVEDATLGSNSKILFNEYQSISSSLAKTIFHSAIEKMNEKCSSSFYKKWFEIVQKRKNIIQLIKPSLIDKNHITKDEFIEIMQKHSRKKIQLQQYQFLIMKCYDKDQSQNQIVLNVELIFDFLDKVSNGNTNFNETKQNQKTTQF